MVAEDMYNDGIDFEKSYKETMADIDENTTIKAKVLSIDEKEGVVFVDVNLKSEAQVPLTDFLEKPSVGEEIDVYLIYKENNEGVPSVSLTKARQIKEKESLMDKINANEPVEGEVVEVKKYGVIVKYGTLYGLIPFPLWDKKRVEKLDSIKEKKIRFYIEKHAQNRDVKGGKKEGQKEDFIGNRKRVLIDDIKKAKAEFFEETKVDDILEGSVKNIADFGAFVDVGKGVEGLLHIKNISWTKIVHVTDVLKSGDKIKVKVLSVDKEKGQVSLGLKQLEELPWDKFIAAYKVDDIVKGSISSIMPYGAFVKIIDGVEALLHISDMSWTKNIKHPKELVNKGQTVEVKIISIDLENKKINVSLKHLLENPWDKVEEKYPIGSKVKGKVKSVTVFGAFIELEEGVDALLHKDEISWVDAVDPMAYFKVGDEIEVAVIQIDKENGKIKVSLKQLEYDPWKSVPSTLKEGDVLECLVKEIDMEKGIVVEPFDGFTVVVPFSQVAFGKPEEIKEIVRTKFKIGDKAKAFVKDFDMKKRIFFLSIKDFDRAAEKKKVQEFLKDKDDNKFTLGDMIKNKND